jgi:hypothetical protein
MKVNKMVQSIKDPQQEYANPAFIIIFAVLVLSFRIGICPGAFKQFVKFAVSKPDTPTLRAVSICMINRSPTTRFTSHVGHSLIKHKSHHYEDIGLPMEE